MSKICGTLFMRFLFSYFSVLALPHFNDHFIWFPFHVTHSTRVYICSISNSVECDDDVNDDFEILKT